MPGRLSPAEDEEEMLKRAIAMSLEEEEEEEVEKEEYKEKEIFSTKGGPLFKLQQKYV